MVAACCGTFAWAGSDSLLVYDVKQGTPQSAGSWLVDVPGNSPRYLAPHFGLPSSSGLVAVSRPDVGQTDVLRLDGTVVSSIKNGGSQTWISPDGARAAWLERAAGSTKSSLVSRPVNLRVSGVDGTGARLVRSLLAAELDWLPDNRHVLLLGRELDGSNPGVWEIDIDTGATRVLASSPFPQALQLSPDGKSFAYLGTFTGKPEEDGIWVVNIDSGQRTHVPGLGGFRWAGDSRSLWLLHVNSGQAADEFDRVDVASGRTVASHALAGHVRQDDWAAAPGGDFVAFWRDDDGKVAVEALGG